MRKILQNKEKQANFGEFLFREFKRIIFVKFSDYLNQCYGYSVHYELNMYFLTCTPFLQSDLPINWNERSKLMLVNIVSTVVSRFSGLSRFNGLPRSLFPSQVHYFDLVDSYLALYT